MHPHSSQDHREPKKTPAMMVGLENDPSTASPLLTPRQVKARIENLEGRVRILEGTNSPTPNLSSPLRSQKRSASDIDREYEHLCEQQSVLQKRLRTNRKARAQLQHVSDAGAMAHTESSSAAARAWSAEEVELGARGSWEYTNDVAQYISTLAETDDGRSDSNTVLVARTSSPEFQNAQEPLPLPIPSSDLSLVAEIEHLDVEYSEIQDPAASASSRENTPMSLLPHQPPEFSIGMSKQSLYKFPDLRAVLRD
jgi:hypothetical protein